MTERFTFSEEELKHYSPPDMPEGVTGAEVYIPDSGLVTIAWIQPALAPQLIALGIDPAARHKLLTAEPDSETLD